jgi:hypothetical protein
VNTASAPGDIVANQSETPSGPASQGSVSKKELDSTLSVRAATRQLKRGQILQYSVIIYNVRLDKATAKPQLHTQVRLFRDGQVVFTGKDSGLGDLNQPDLKRLTVGGGLKLGADLIPGEYVLQITATDPLADEKHRVATQWIDFEIIK